MKKVGKRNKKTKINKKIDKKHKDIYEVKNYN